MAYCNLTPHALTIHHSNGSTTQLDPHGQSLRVSSKSTLVGEFNGVEHFAVEYGELETIDNGNKSVIGGLPVATVGVIYVVSGQCLEAIKQKGGRGDFAAPGELVRDANGQPIGCKGLKV